MVVPRVTLGISYCIKTDRYIGVAMKSEELSFNQIHNRMVN